MQNSLATRCNKKKQEVTNKANTPGASHLQLPCALLLVESAGDWRSSKTWTNVSFLSHCPILLFSVSHRTHTCVWVAKWFENNFISDLLGLVFLSESPKGLLHANTFALPAYDNLCRLFYRPQVGCPKRHASFRQLNILPQMDFLSVTEERWFIDFSADLLGIRWCWQSELTWLLLFRRFLQAKRFTKTSMRKYWVSVLLYWSDFIFQSCHRSVLLDLINVIELHRSEETREGWFPLGAVEVLQTLILHVDWSNR